MATNSFDSPQKNWLLHSLLQDDLTITKLRKNSNTPRKQNNLSECLQYLTNSQILYWNLIGQNKSTQLKIDQLATLLRSGQNWSQGHNFDRIA